MSKSAIYTANTTIQDIADGGMLNPGTVVRRFGCNCFLSGNTINISGTGYYDVDVSLTLSGTTEGEVTLNVYKDGVEIPGAEASTTIAAAGDLTNLSISCLVREYCPCADSSSNLTFVLSGIPTTVTNSAIVVEKI